MGEPLVITVFLLTAVTMRFPFTCKQPLWAVQLAHNHVEQRLDVAFGVGAALVILLGEGLGRFDGNSLYCGKRRLAG